MLAYSCKGRYFCTSCHTKRAVACAEWLHSTVLWPVAHRQIVLTIPKMLRAYFRYDRRLLGELCRVVAGVIAESFRVLLGQPAAEPGLVICGHTFGKLLNFHPHLHVMASGFTPEGVFHPLPTLSLASIEELFRHRVCGMLQRKRLLTPERVKLMRSWAHSGFNVDATVRIGADDAAGRENLARCLVRAPFSMNKICYDHAAQSVISKTKMVPGANRNFEVKKVFAADPLECPDCGGAMRIIAFIEERRVERAILVHLSLWDEARPPRATSAGTPRASAELEYLPWVE